MQIQETDSYKELVVSFDEFIDLIKPENKAKLCNLIDGNISTKLIFRGQEFSDYDLKPSIFRGQFISKENSIESSVEKFSFLKKFIEGCDLNGIAIPGDSFELRERMLQGFPDTALHKLENWPDKGLYELIGFAQHFGYPTEFLDWSYSPLVACYFAASNVIKNFQETDINKLMSIWVFDTEKKNLLNDYKQLNFEVINIPKALNVNISAQQGCFTLVRQTINSEIKLLTHLTAKKQVKALLKLSLPRKDAVNLLKFCNLYAVNAASLFRCADGAAQYALDDLYQSIFNKKIESFKEYK